MSYKLYKIFIRNFFSEKISFHDLVRSLHSLKFSRILIILVVNQLNYSLDSKSMEIVDSVAQSAIYKSIEQG